MRLKRALKATEKPVWHKLTGFFLWEHAMKTIGIIGGLGWPSTLDYYRLLCVKTANAGRDRGAAVPYPTPHLLMESLNMARMRELRGTDGDDRSWESYE